MSEAEDETRLREELTAEYMQLQKAYEDFDGRVLTIKSWTSVLTLGGVAAGYKELSIGVLMVTALGAAYLWFLETRWKSFQYCYIDRIRKLESFFRGEEPAFPPMQIFESWLQAYAVQKTYQALLKIALAPFVMVPYLPIVILCIAGILYSALWGPPHSPPLRT
jgi:hypothetical protein